MDQQTGEGVGNDKEEKSYLPMCSTYFPLRSAFTSTRCMPASMAHLKQSSPVPATLTTALLVWIHRGSGMYVKGRAAIMSTGGVRNGRIPTPIRSIGIPLRSLLAVG